MSATAEHTSSWHIASGELPQWKSPEPGLWVASVVGEYRGMVESIGQDYLATDAVGQFVGAFGSLRAAQLALHPEIERAASDGVERGLMIAAVITASIASVIAALGAWVFFA